MSHADQFMISQYVVRDKIADTTKNYIQIPMSPEFISFYKFRENYSVGRFEVTQFIWKFDLNIKLSL